MNKLKLELDLTEQEYHNALRLCDIFDLSQSQENLLFVIKKIIINHGLHIPMPLGKMTAWASQEDNGTEVGIGFVTTEGDFVDLATALYNNKTKKIETKIFSDIFTEDATSKFTFEEKDIRKAFSE
ncbi:MAG: hypothetical protein J6N21_20110 [Butyrivibrio sp.]|nr:hypothetical protein [Butyrivibrio sp.]